MKPSSASPSQANSNNTKSINITNPAITKYYLSSILPFQTISHPKQFVKNKQFYKPEQFIWNNPHRTSKRLFPYYHQANQNYQKNIKPKVEKQIQEDREQREVQRIKALSLIRNQTRRRFLSRQQMRVRLQQQTDSRKRNITSNNTQFKNYGDMHDGDDYQLMINTQKGNTKYLQTHSVGLKKSKINNSHSQIKNSKNLTITEQSYYQGVNQWDKNAQRIRNIFTEQLINNHNKIRTQFKARKQLNETFNRSKVSYKNRHSENTQSNIRKE